VAVTRWCTVLTTTVYTKHDGVTPFSAALGRGQVGTAIGVVVPSDRVVVPTRAPSSRPPQSVTAIGVAVHRTGHGGALVAAHRAQQCLLFFTFFTTFANVLTLQVFYHYVQVC
jgi:hypothetical protein